MKLINFIIKTNYKFDHMHTDKVSLAYLLFMFLLIPQAYLTTIIESPLIFALPIVYIALAFLWRGIYLGIKLYKTYNNKN